MPTYSYECKKCGHVVDIFHPMSAKPRVKCKECGGSCARLLGTGSGIIFKGSGFYETDYKTKSGKKPPEPAAAGESKSGNGPSGEKKSTEQKPSTTKPEKKTTPSANQPG